MATGRIWLGLHPPADPLDGWPPAILDDDRNILAWDYDPENTVHVRLYPWADVVYKRPKEGAGLPLEKKELQMPVVSIGTWTEGTKKEDLNVSAIVGGWLGQPRLRGA